MSEFDPVSYIMGAKSAGGGGGGGDSPIKSLATISDTKTVTPNTHGEYEIDFVSTVLANDHPAYVACKNVVVTVGGITTVIPYVNYNSSPVSTPSNIENGAIAITINNDDFWSLRFEAEGSPEITVSVVGELYTLSDDLFALMYV